eukprot:COSAG02_NODE_12013_length_1613_cov_2.077279_2_plen_130_part_00
MEMYQSEDAAAMARIRLSSHTSMSSWLPPVRLYRYGVLVLFVPMRLWSILRQVHVSFGTSTSRFNFTDVCFPQTWFKYMSTRYERSEPASAAQDASGPRSGLFRSKNKQPSDTAVQMQPGLELEPQPEQ